MDVLLESVHVPLLLSCVPSKASNKLKGELDAKSFSQTILLIAFPAFGSCKILICTIVACSGHGFGAKF